MLSSFSKKIKCFYFRTGCGAFDKILFCKKMLVTNLFTVLPSGLFRTSSLFLVGISDQLEVLV